MRLEHPTAAAWLPRLAAGFTEQILKEWAGIEAMHPTTALSVAPPLAVCIKIDGAYSSRLLAYGDLALFCRMAQTLFRCSEPDAEQIEETAKEFLNILCGKLISEIYQKTGIPARFYIPHFFAPEEVPDIDLQQGKTLWLCSERNEHLVLYFVNTKTAGKGDESYEIPPNGSR